MKSSVQQGWYSTLHHIALPLSIMAPPKISGQVHNFSVSVQFCLLTAQCLVASFCWWQQTSSIAVFPCRVMQETWLFKAEGQGLGILEEIKIGHSDVLASRVKHQIVPSAELSAVATGKRGGRQKGGKTETESNKRNKDEINVSPTFNELYYYRFAEKSRQNLLWLCLHILVTKIGNRISQTLVSNMVCDLTSFTLMIYFYPTPFGISISFSKLCVIYLATTLYVHP